MKKDNKPEKAFEFPQRKYTNEEIEMNKQQQNLANMRATKEHNLFMHSQVPEVEPEDTDTIHPDYKGIPMLANIPFKEPAPMAYGIDPYATDNGSSELTIEKKVASYSGGSSKQRCFIGIDNGVSGSIGIIREDGTYAFHKTPVRSELNYTKEKAMITRIKPVDLTKLLSEAGPGSMVMIERPMVNPKMFKASTSALRAFEATIVVLETLGIAYEVCDSKEWQRGTLPKGVNGDALKPASMDVGNRLYPDAQSVKHPDRDGMLIAHHCKIKHR